VPNIRSALIPALPRPAWIVLGGDFASAVGSGLTLPCLFIYAHLARGLSDGGAGLVVAMTALTSLIGNPLGGLAADRWTSRRALMAGLVVAAAGSVALAVAHAAVALLASAGLVGFGLAVIWPAQNALLADLAGQAGASAVFAVRNASLNAGLGIGAVCSAAVVSVAHPASFTVVYLADAASFLAFVPVLARLRVPASAALSPPRPTGEAEESGQSAEPGERRESGQPRSAGQSGQSRQPGQPRLAGRGLVRDTTFWRVWVLTALIVTLSFGQFQSSLPGYATRPGGISTHILALGFAANTVTVVGAQLVVLRLLAGRRRTTGAALAAATWAASWVVVVIGGHLGGHAAEVAFVCAMAVFGVGETLLSPTLPVIMNDLAPPGAAGRYNGLGVMAFTTGFLLGPVGGGAALGAGWGAALFAGLALACASASVAALWLGRHLPDHANMIPGQPDPGASGDPGAASHAGDGCDPGDGRVAGDGHDSVGTGACAHGPAHDLTPTG
jgi:MFS family permease